MTPMGVLRTRVIAPATNRLFVSHVARDLGAHLDVRITVSEFTDIG